VRVAQTVGGTINYHRGLLERFLSQVGWLYAQLFKLDHRLWGNGELGPATDEGSDFGTVRETWAVFVKRHLVYGKRLSGME
jgi:hypothetical protein